MKHNIKIPTLPDGIIVSPKDCISKFSFKIHLVEKS